MGSPGALGGWTLRPQREEGGAAAMQLVRQVCFEPCALTLLRQAPSSWLLAATHTSSETFFQNEATFKFKLYYISMGIHPSYLSLVPSFRTSNSNHQGDLMIYQQKLSTAYSGVRSSNKNRQLFLGYNMVRTTRPLDI